MDQHITVSFSSASKSVNAQRRRASVLSRAVNMAAAACGRVAAVLRAFQHHKVQDRGLSSGLSGDAGGHSGAGVVGQVGGGGGGVEEVLLLVVVVVVVVVVVRSRYQ